MRLFLLLALLPLLAARAQTDVPPPLPSGFDPHAAAPPGLPDKLEIPANTRTEIKVWRKSRPASPPRPDDPHLLWDPDLEEAVFERGPKDIHAVYRWEGGQTTEAFAIRGLWFRIITLAYPDQIRTSGTPPGFFLNRQLGVTSGAGFGGGFPGVFGYSPSSYAGSAVLNGRPLLVFPLGGPADGTAFPTGICTCLDAKTLLPIWLDDGAFVATFSYSAAPDVRIEPQGLF